MEEIPEIQEDLGNGGKVKNWLQDNVRIILSVLIVVAIAAGIYSYSKRADVSMTSEEVALEEIEQQQGEEAVTIIGEEDKDASSEEDDSQQQEQTEETPKTEEGSTADVKVETGEVSGGQVSTSQETGEAFVQTAVAGDSVTTLSRKALRNYLEKNNDSSLTAEHKIYIEDYMRKHVGHSGALHVGNEITFSKTLINDAIEKSKTLTDSQLENLKKYSARVSNL